jgi:hypothetical protein
VPFQHCAQIRTRWRFYVQRLDESWWNQYYVVVPECRIHYSKEIQVIHNKELFLGDGKYATDVVLRGDLGWSSVNIRGKIEVFRL